MLLSGILLLYGKQPVCYEGGEGVKLGIGNDPLIFWESTFSWSPEDAVRTKLVKEGLKT